MDQYRARSAYKLEEIDSKFKIFFKGANVVWTFPHFFIRTMDFAILLLERGGLLFSVFRMMETQALSFLCQKLDCGAAPGSWMQVALKRVGPENPRQPAALKQEDSVPPRKTGGIVIGIDLLSISPL